MSTKIICLAIIIFLTSCECPASSSLANLQTGTVDLVLNNNGMISRSMFLKTFKTEFEKIPMISLTFHDFAIHNDQLRRWILTAQSINLESFVIAFEYEHNFWMKFQVGFWATSRNDLILGTSSAQLGSVSGQTITTSFNLPQPIENLEGAVARAFLNGFVSDLLTSVQIRLALKTLTTNSLQANIIIGQNMTLQTIYLSFIIFSPRSAPFASYGSSFTQIDFQGTKTYDLHRMIYNSPYVFMGFSNFKLSGAQVLAFTLNINEDMLLSIDSNRPFDEFTLSYIVIGTNSQLICEECENKFIYKNQCVKSCPANTYEFTYASGNAFACRECSAELNLVVNPTGTGCICKQGHEQINGICERVEFQVEEQIEDWHPQRIRRLQRSDCSGIENTYWTGYRCACRVGYVTQSGVCVPLNLTPLPDAFTPSEFIYKISKLYRAVQCATSLEEFNGEVCVCIEGYFRTIDGTCEEMNNCPPNSMWVNGNCVCNSGFVMRNMRCVVQCPPNSADNGLGECVCNSGYFRSADGTCVLGAECPPFSTRNNQGICVCIEGYIDLGGFCSRCEEGRIFSEQEQKCILPCGINEVEMNGMCRCKEGFGKFSDICQQCPTGFFVKDDFCVSCTNQATFNPTTQMCQCNNGLPFNSAGLCSNNCPDDNQVFDPAANRCVCVEGLGFLNGQCALCAFGVNPETFECKAGCQPTQVLESNQCVCAVGFGRNANNECIDCSTISGGFLFEGSCAICPSTYVVSNNMCVCPEGSTDIGGTCVASCQQGQLIDQNGRCYVCPLNEMPVNGQCQCDAGFVRDNAGRCIISCPGNQVLINGLCATCAGGTVYDANLQSCVCPDGFYKNNFGICQQTVFTPVACDPGFYFEQNNGCVSCPSGCLECTSAQKCTRCPEFYEPVGASCNPNCGDGYAIPGVQDCDDGNMMSNDGCMNCMVMNGWTCSGIQPSICTITITRTRTNMGPVCGDGMIASTEQCDDANTMNGDGCSMMCQTEDDFDCTGQPSVCTMQPTTPQNQGMKLKSVSTNMVNAFIIVETDDFWSFPSQQEMKSFMQYDFPDPSTKSISAYCIQNPVAMNMFQCLFLYPSGIPNQQYYINLSYNRDGKSGSLQVEIDPLASAFASRSLL